MALVILPAKSDMAMRLGVVIFLASLSVLVQPTEVWKVRLLYLYGKCGSIPKSSVKFSDSNTNT